MAIILNYCIVLDVSVTGNVTYCIKCDPVGKNPYNCMLYYHCTEGDLIAEHTCEKKVQILCVQLKYSYKPIVYAQKVIKIDKGSRWIETSKKPMPASTFRRLSLQPSTKPKCQI
jgi:hypothetical protein